MNKRHLYPKNWNSLKLIIRIRDRFSCQICGKKESEIYSKKGKKLSLHVMHLDGNTFNNKYVASGSLFNNVENNLVSGCPSCHRLYDRRNGIPENYTKKQNHQIIDLSNICQ